VSGSRVLVALRVRAPAERTFAAFTGEISQWWRPNGLFQFTDRDGGLLAFEPDPPERLVEIGTDGERFEIGPVRVWDPPHRLVFGWRQARFDDDQSTEVSVRFDAVDDGTRVTVEHFGWDTVPQEHAARHGIPLGVFQQREAEWWQLLLRSLRDRVAPAET
jgi:uncharacterized protein YndB with AHSA1/START domain